MKLFLSPLLYYYARRPDGQTEFEVEGATIREALENLEIVYSLDVSSLLTRNGELRRTVNIYVNEKDIRLMEGIETALQPEDEIHCLSAVSGG